MPNRKRAEKWANWLGQFCPGVVAVFLSGSLAQNALKWDDPSADIDFFVITRPNQIWTARFFVFLWLKLTRNLATEANHAGNICPNHFVSTNALEFSQKNAYTADLVVNMQPFFDPLGLFTPFREANGWIVDFKKGFSALTVDFPQKKGAVRNWRGFGMVLLEMVLKKVQIWKIQRNKLSFLPDAEIVLKDDEIRFHPRPRWRKFG